MTRMAKLTWVELKLQFRDWGAITFGLLFPAVLLLVLGFAFPGFRDPDPNLNGGRLIDLYTPIALVLVLVMVGVSTVATVLTGYRQDGILRRLRTTPLRPARLLVAQLVSQLTVAAGGLLLAILAASVVLDVPTPASWGGVLVALALAAGALFSIGLLIGALARTNSAAQGISMVAWLPIMVLAGLWFPREAMPETMRRLSDLSPGGAGVDAVQQAWFGVGAPGASLAVLAGFTVLIGSVAVMLFRWE